MSGAVKPSGLWPGIRRQRYGVAFVLAVAGATVALYGLRAAGRLLMVEDPLQPAQSIVALGDELFNLVG